MEKPCFFRTTHAWLRIRCTRYVREPTFRRKHSDPDSHDPAAPNFNRNRIKTISTGGFSLKWYAPVCSGLPAATLGKHQGHGFLVVTPMLRDRVMIGVCGKKVNKGSEENSISLNDWRVACQWVNLRLTLPCEPYHSNGISLRPSVGSRMRKILTGRRPDQGT